MPCFAHLQGIFECDFKKFVGRKVMENIMNICIYGAASADIDQKYIKKGEELSEVLASHGHNLVFGGGANGMMGAAARGFYRKGAKITGVVPTFFNVDGILFEHCDKLIRTETMRQRKQNMEDLADAFIITPGGIGTFEEFFEILTLKQLGRHEKPIVIFDIDNYYDGIIELINQAIKKNFMTEKSRSLFYVTEHIDEVCNYLDNYSPENFNILEYRKIKEN